MKLGDNLRGAWATSPYGTSYLGNVSADWSTPAGQLTTTPTVLQTTVVAGAGRKRCGAVSGRVEVCAARYGSNGWLGVATVWVSGTHIAQATVKMNDTYFDTSTYGTQEWRRSVLCQEVGHTFGLDHQSEASEVNTGSCMDYYKVPNIAPNGHDYDELALIYDHTDVSTTKTKPGRGNGRRGGLKRVREGLYVENLGDGRRRVVSVFWRDQDAQHLGVPAGA